MGHQGLDLLERHSLLDRTLHPHQADPVLILEQLADDPNSPVAEVVNVVDSLRGVGAILEVHQVLDGRENVLPLQRRQVSQGDFFDDAFGSLGSELDPFVRIVCQLVVELQTAHARKVVAFPVEEEVVEEIRGRVEGRRIAGPQAPVDLDDGFVRRQRLVGAQRVAQRHPGGERIEKEERKLGDPSLFELFEVGLREILVALEEHFARRFVDDVHRCHALDRIHPNEIFDADLDPLQASLGDLAHPRSGDLAIFAYQDLSVVVADLPRAALSDHKAGNNALHDLLALDPNRFRFIEIGEQFLG